MFSITFDDIGKAVLIKSLENERKKYEKMILDGDCSPGTLIMHEQLFKMMRGILYCRAQKKEEAEAPSIQEDVSEDQLDPSVSTNSLLIATTEPSDASTTKK